METNSFCGARFSLLLLSATLAIPASLLLLCPSSAHAQGGVPLWTNRYSYGPGNGAHPTAIATDSSGNVVVTGNSYNGTDYYYATIKYSSEGVPLWTNRYNVNLNGNPGFVAVAVDADGNAFVTGSSTTAAGSLEYVTLKYSSSGVPLWTNFNGPGGTQAVAVDRS